MDHVMVQRKGSLVGKGYAQELEKTKLNGCVI